MILKSKIWLIFSVIILCSSAAFAVPPKANPLPSDYHTGLTWEEAEKSNKPMVVNFYVDWCNYCRKFAPVFDKLRKEYEGKYNFVIVKTDDLKNEKIVKKHNIHSFPSVFLINKKKDKEVFINQQKYFNMQEMKQELDTFLE
ncbi:MAG: hypothetical protein A2Y25_09480 [Candidatus Melainabacteria bacterium GWF2_37_15]|nr:MAG: hypothetical protein A2Y25_09480 [Candidatus Melainabacteria bacterium GWF2_37_15]